MTDDARRIRVPNGVGATVLGDTQATYQACAAATGYSSDYINRAALTQGVWLCARTSEGRYASLRVVEVYDEAITFEAITFEVVTYEKL